MGQLPFGLKLSRYLGPFASSVWRPWVLHAEPVTIQFHWGHSAAFCRASQCEPLAHGTVSRGKLLEMADGTIRSSLTQSLQPRGAHRELLELGHWFVYPQRGSSQTCYIICPVERQSEIGRHYHNMTSAFWDEQQCSHTHRQGPGCDEHCIPSGYRPHSGRFSCFQYGWNCWKQHGESIASSCCRSDSVNLLFGLNWLWGNL